MKDDHEDEKRSPDELEPGAPGIQDLLEAAAAENTSLTTPLSLVLNGPEEEAYQATLTTRHIYGTLIIGGILGIFGARRATSQNTKWKGLYFDIVVYFGIVILAAFYPWMLYLRCQPSERRCIIRWTSNVAMLLGYIQMCAFVIGARQAVVDCDDKFNLAFWTGTYMTVMPLLAILAGLNFHWNALGYLAMMVAFYSSPPVTHRQSVFVVLFNAASMTGIVMGVCYALEHISRSSFLLNLKTIELLRKERQSTREAQRMAASLVRTVSTIAHDIKTPLAAVQIGVDLSIDFLKKEEFEQVDVIFQSINSATQMTAILLNGLSASAALLDRGEHALEPTLAHVSIPEVVESALGACRLWATNNIELTSSGESPTSVDESD